jgi:hypothetical protein
MWTQRHKRRYESLLLLKAWRTDTRRSLCLGLGIVFVFILHHSAVHTFLTPASLLPHPTYPSYLPPFLLTLPRHIPPPLEYVHTLLCTPPLLLLLTIYPCKRCGQTDRDGEDGVETSIRSCKHESNRGSREEEADFDIICWIAIVWVSKMRSWRALIV